MVANSPRCPSYHLRGTYITWGGNRLLASRSRGAYRSDSNLLRAAYRPGVDDDGIGIGSWRTKPDPPGVRPYIAPTRRAAYGLLAANIVSVSSCVVFVIYEVSLAGWLAAGSLGASVLTVLSGLLGVFLIAAFTQILQTRMVSRLTAKRASSRQLFTGIGMLVVIALGYFLVTMIPHWFADSGGATAFFPLLVQKLTGSTAQIFWCFLALTPLAPFLLAPFVMAHFYWGLALSLVSTCFYGVLILRVWPKVFANALMGRGQVLAEVSAAKNLDASFNENSEDVWRIPLLARALPLSPVGQIHWARISYYQRKDPRQIISLSSILYVAVIFGIMLWANHLGRNGFFGR